MKQYEHGGHVWEGNPNQWIDFSANINPLGCPNPMKKAMKEAIDCVQYYPEATMKQAIQQLCRFIGVNEQQVLPTSGGIDALNFIIRHVKPKRLMIFTPGFVEYEHIGVACDIPLLFVPIIKERNVVEVDFQYIESVIQEDDMLIVCNPVNPIGVAFNKEEMSKLLEIVKSTNAYMLIDEAFIHYCLDYSSKDKITQYSRLIIAGSLTKIFAIPGVRLGYIIANESLLSFLKERQMPWTLSTFATSVTMVLDNMEHFCEQSIKQNETNRAKLKDELANLGLTVFPSESNFLFLDIKKTGVTVEQIAKQLKQSNILIRNCSNYRELDEYYMRVAVKNEQDNQWLVNVMKRILKEKK